MTESMKRLLTRVRRALSQSEASLPHSIMAQAGSLANDLYNMLHEKNGFFLFGPALHVFPCESNELSWGIVDWNMPGLWKHEYSSFVDLGLCFAEDIFGNQFCIKDGSVFSFDVETGNLKQIASSLDDWAGLILGNDRFWTGWPIAQQWSEIHGAFPLHKRFHAATPFCCGGSYGLENLRPIDAGEMMAGWGSFATQIRNIPEGDQFQLKIVD
jgi:hypothetical protein